MKPTLKLALVGAVCALIGLLLPRGSWTEASGHYSSYGLPLEALCFRHGDMVSGWHVEPDWIALILDTVIWGVVGFAGLLFCRRLYRRSGRES